MNRTAKLLYHQIHPLKLLTDFSTSFVASALLWWHEPIVTFLLVAFLPSIVITALLVRFADLQRLQQSAFGHYVAAHMTSAVTLQRINGQAVMWIGAYSREPIVMALGLAGILLAWSSGLGRPQL